MKIECCVPVVGGDENKARNPRMVEKDMNRIRLSVAYSLGGTNWFTYKNEPRGYYLCATPEYACEHMVNCVLGAGAKHLLLEVPRQSKKRAMEACAKAGQLAPQLVEWCCKEYGLTVEPAEIKFNVEG